jgi:hypothetical protein
MATKAKEDKKKAAPSLEARVKAIEEFLKHNTRFKSAE